MTLEEFKDLVKKLDPGLASVATMDRLIQIEEKLDRLLKLHEK